MRVKLNSKEIKGLEDVVFALGALLSETNENIVTGTLLEAQGLAMASGQPAPVVEYYGKLAALRGSERDLAIIAFMRLVGTWARDGYLEMP